MHLTVVAFSFQSNLDKQTFRPLYLSNNRIVAILYSPLGCKSWQSFGHNKLIVTTSTIIFVDSMPNMFYLVWIAATAAYALVGPMPLPATTEKVPAILLRGNQSGKKCLKYTKQMHFKLRRKIMLCLLDLSRNFPTVLFRSKRSYFSNFHLNMYALSQHW